MNRISHTIRHLHTMKISICRQIALFVALFLLGSVGYAQSVVSQQNSQDHTQYNLGDSMKYDLSMVRYFGVSATDGKMSRIDDVSDPGSTWIGWGLDTSSANFMGYQNPNAREGYFNPQFSGEVTKTGGSGGDKVTYEWAVLNAGYHILRIDFDFEKVPAIMVKDDGQCKNDRGKVVFECSAKFMGHTGNLSPTITQKQVTLYNKGTGKVQFRDTLEGTGSETHTITIRPYQLTKFYVTGSTPSSAMNDVEIAAKYNGDDIFNKGDLTVLWVDATKRVTGKISGDNSAKPAILGQGRPDILGEIKNVVPGAALCVFAFEFKGQVKPGGFSQNIHFQRDLLGNDAFGVVANGDFYITTKRTNNFSCPNIGDPTGSDVSGAVFRDDMAPIIYDFDAPGFEGVPLPNEPTTFEKYGNFREFAVWNDIRCSTVSRFHVVCKIRHLRDNTGNLKCICSATSADEEIAIPVPLPSPEGPFPVPTH